MLGCGIILAADKLLVAAAVYKRQDGEDDDGKGGDNGAMQESKRNVSIQCFVQLLATGLSQGSYSRRTKTKHGQR